MFEYMRKKKSNTKTVKPIKSHQVPVTVELLDARIKEINIALRAGIQRADSHEARMEMIYERSRIEIRGLIAESEARWEKRQAEFEATWEKRQAEFEATWEKRQAEFEATWGKKQAESEAKWDKQLAEFKKGQAERDCRFAALEKRMDQFEARVEKRFNDIERSIIELGNRLEKKIARLESIILEQEARNKYVLDGYASLSLRIEKTETRLDALESNQ